MSDFFLAPPVGMLSELRVLLVPGATVPGAITNGERACTPVSCMHIMYTYAHGKRKDKTHRVRIHLVRKSS